jgi:hypothetical protein
LELDFAINRDGLVEPSHAATYAALGAWIRGCYGTALAATNGSLGALDDQLTLSLAQPTLVDRVVIQEQLELGQRIRNFTVESQHAPGGPWLPYGGGESVGHKRILLLENRSVVALRLHVTARMAATLEPVVANFAAFAPCSTGTDNPDAALKADDDSARGAQGGIRFNFPRKTRHGIKQDVPFGSSMVLQRGPMTARVWGTVARNITARPTDITGGTVAAGAAAVAGTVEHDDVVISVKLLSSAGRVLASASATVTANGTWSVELLPLSPTLNATLVASTSSSDDHHGGGGSSVKLTDIAVGDVYLCSGQSNMGFQLSSSASWVHNTSGARFYDLSLLRLMATTTEALLDDDEEAEEGRPQGELREGSGAQPAGQWARSNATVAGPFSAICWYAGARMLAEAAPLPAGEGGGQLAIGLIEAAVGGTPVQFWESLAAVDGCAAAVANNETGGAANLYAQYVQPLGALGLRGIFWDQAEQNMNVPNPHHNEAHHENTGQILADAYSCMIQQLVTEWRAQFHAPTLPFVYVELCLGDIWYDVGHMAMWMAQRGAAKLPSVGFATTTDIEQMVHAPNKTEVARRLVLEMNRIAQTPTRAPPGGPSHGPALTSAVRAASAGTVTLTFENSSKEMRVRHATFLPLVIVLMHGDRLYLDS